MAYAGSPTALDLLSALLPQHELVILLFSVVVACILMQSRKLTPHFYRLPYGIFVLLWYVVPLLSVFCFSVVSGNSIFDARYYFWFSPALALLITHVLDAFQSRYLRLTAACLFIVLMFIKSFITHPFVEDWRGAISAAAKIGDLHDVKVIASTGLAESADIEWVTKPAQRDYLLAPFSLYQLGTDAILLPATIENTASSAYWRNSVLSEIADVERLVLIVRMTYVQDRDGNPVTSDVYYTKKLEGHGATHTRSQEFGHVRLLEFEF